MGTLRFYIPGYRNDPSYPKQKEFLKSTEGNLKSFNLSSQISTWTGLERDADTFSAKMRNRSFIILNKKSFWNRCTGKKVPKYKVAIFCQIAILAHLFLCNDFKFFFGIMNFGWVLWKSYYTLLLKKCLRPCPCLYMYLSQRINWIAYFKFPLVDFKNSFCFR